MTASHSIKSPSLTGPRRSMPFSSFCSVLHVSNSFISRRLALRDAATEFDDDGGIALVECDIRARRSNDTARNLSRL